MSTTYTREQIADMNAQYSPRLSVPNVEEYLEATAASSAKVRSALNGELDIAYGDSDGQKLDVFPAAKTNARVHVFIHGGYWRALDKSVYSNVAGPLIEAGTTAVLVNYDLCPQGTRLGNHRASPPVAGLDLSQYRWFQW